LQRSLKRRCGKVFQRSAEAADGRSDRAYDYYFSHGFPPVFLLKLITSFNLTGMNMIPLAVIMPLFNSINHNMNPKKNNTNPKVELIKIRK
jgi:hypothetical protein